MSEKSTKIQRPLTIDEISPRIRAMLTRAEYIGICAMQAPGAWTRIGATWVTPEGRWINIGQGVGSWGTSRGLGQLASDDDARPEWHAPAVVICPDPNAVFVLTDAAITAYGLNVYETLAARLTGKE